MTVHWTNDVQPAQTNQVHANHGLYGFSGEGISCNLAAFQLFSRAGACASEFITKPRHSGDAEGTGLLGCDAASLGERFPTFWHNIVRSSKKSAWPLKMKAPQSFETSVTTHPTTHRHTPQDLNPHITVLYEIKHGDSLLRISICCKYLAS